MIRSVLAVLCGLLFWAQAVHAQAVRTIPLTANDLAYSPLTGRLYASIGATGQITEIDPVAGTVGVSFAVGSQPNRLAVSDTGEYLYVGLDGLPGVVRVHLPTRTVGTPFPLGAPDPTFGARGAEDLAVLPGNPDAVAVARRFNGVSPRHAGVAVYDSGVERTNVTAVHTGSNVIAFGATAGRLYGYNIETSEFGFRRMDVGPTGVTILESTSGLLDGSTDIEALGGRVFGNNGRVVDGEARTLVTTMPGMTVAGLTSLEATPAGIYFMTRDASTGWVLRTFDPTTLTLTSEGPMPNVVHIGSLASAGPNRLGLVTRDAVGGGRVLLITPSLVIPSPPTITITGPTATATLTAESASITLSGVAGDTNGIVGGVTWVSDRGYIGSANGTTNWTAGEIPLLLGSNLITVTATDDTGETSTDTIEVAVPAFSSFLAEGATGAFFDYDLALANPSLASVDADIAYFTQGGGTVTQTVTLPAQSRRTVRVDDVPGLAATTMSTSVRTTTAPIVVERTMRWDARPATARTPTRRRPARR